MSFSALDLALSWSYFLIHAVLTVCSWGPQKLLLFANNFFITTFQFHKIHLAEYVPAWAVDVKYWFSLSSQSSFIISAGMSDVPLPCVWLREEFWDCHRILFTGLRGSWDTRLLFYSCYRSLWCLIHIRGIWSPFCTTDTSALLHPKIFN